MMVDFIFTLTVGYHFIRNEGTIGINDMYNLRNIFRH